MSPAGFILTSNRDESLDRKPAALPKKYVVNGIEVIYPKDEQAQGTWILTSSNHYTLCLLNGAFDSHIPNPPYRKSRGLMLLDFFQYNEVEHFVSGYNFEGIEPFTLTIAYSKQDVQLNEIRWDGNAITNTVLDASLPHIWSSVTLYTAETIAKRKQWFAEWLKEHPIYSTDAILQFHHFGGAGDEENDLVMQRSNRKQTVSISCVAHTAEGSSFFYKDLLAEKSSCKLSA